MCFGDMREAVLARDIYRCRVCGAEGRRKRSIIVHHRVPGRSLLPLLISLCPGCHSEVHRIKVMRMSISPLLVELWREQHPTGHEQTLLNFQTRQLPQETMRPFAEPASSLHLARDYLLSLDELGPEHQISSDNLDQRFAVQNSRSTADRHGRCGSSDDLRLPDQLLTN